MIKKHFKILILLICFIFIFKININFSSGVNDINNIKESEYDLEINNIDNKIDIDFRFDITRLLLINLFDFENYNLTNGCFINDMRNAFFNDVLSYKKNLGDYVGYDEIVLFENFENQKEIRSILNFQNGNLTINFLFDELSKKIIDYYITKGKSRNQYLGIKYFKRSVLIFLIIICALIIVFNVYKKYKKNKIKKESNDSFIEDTIDIKDENNNTELVAIIMGALSKHLNRDISKLHIKSIKKTGWKRRY